MTATMIMYPTFEPTQQSQQYELPYQPHYHCFADATAASLTNAASSYTQMLTDTHMPHTTSAAASFVPEELRCQYSSKRCENRRTNKKSGGLHKFCAVHREKANRNQMRLDHRRRVLKRLAQRTDGAVAPSSPTTASASTSTASGSRNSPYAKKQFAAQSKSPRNHNHNSDADSKCGIWSVEDDLEIDLMPLALHRENNSAATQSQQSLLDAQDMYILETLLFNDDDKVDSSLTTPTIKIEKQDDEAKGWHVNL